MTMLVFQTYPVGVELVCFLLQWICIDAGHGSKNALYSAWNRNLLKAKVITLENGITMFSVGDYCFEKCTVKVSSTPVYVCVKITKSYLIEAILLHKLWFIYLVFWLIFQYSIPPQVWFSMEFNSFNFENVFWPKYLSFQWSLVLKVS